VAKVKVSKDLTANTPRVLPHFVHSVMLMSVK